MKSKGHREKLKFLANIMNSKTEGKLRPVTKVLDCMECIITPEIADFLLQIGEQKLALKKIRTFSNLDDIKYEVFIKGILKDGLLLLEYEKNEEISTPQTMVELAPMLPGWFELVIASGNIDERNSLFIAKFSELLGLKMSLGIFPLKVLVDTVLKTNKNKYSPIHSVIPRSDGEKKKTLDVNKIIPVSEQEVTQSKTVTALIDSLPPDYPIAVVHCFCRIIQRINGSPCRFHLPEQACIYLGMLAKQACEYKIGEAISKEKAKDIFAKCETKGAIVTLFNEKADINKPEVAICNCCMDCCCIYGLHNRGGLAPLHCKSHYIAKITNGNECIDCKTCEKYCPSAAIKVTNKTPNINDEECIGCGQCSSKCPKSVMKMQPQERNVFVKSKSKKQARFKNV